MSGPREPDGFDDGREDGAGWREPPHLGGGASGEDDDRPNFADRRKQPREDDPAPGQPWQPPGWDLPPAEGQRPVPPAAGGAVPPAPDGTAPGSRAPEDAAPPVQDVPPPAPGPLRGGGLFGRRRRQPTVAERVFAYEGDAVGAQGWALQQGWTVSDGTAPEDAALADLIAGSPVRATKDHRAANVLRGRAGSLEVVAFDVVYASGRYLVPEYAITAVPMLGGVPGFRLSPARFWRHRTGGLLPMPSGDEAFDARWLLLASEDSPQLRRLVQDPTVHGLLLGSDDGDEFWSGAGHVAAVRPDGHRPQLLEHHGRLLTAIAGALMAGA